VPENNNPVPNPPVIPVPHVIVALQGNQLQVTSNIPDNFIVAGLLITAIIAHIMSQQKPQSRILQLS
jgi:hypothetical protein